MQKNHWVKFALISLAAFCVSGQVARVDNKQVAMTKCTRTPDNLADEPGGQNKIEPVTTQKAQPVRRQGAAKKAMDLEIYGEAAVNQEVRKGAAKQALEAVGED